MGLQCSRLGLFLHLLLQGGIVLRARRRGRIRIVVGVFVRLGILLELLLLGLRLGLGLRLLLLLTAFFALAAAGSLVLFLPSTGRCRRLDRRHGRRSLLLLLPEARLLPLRLQLRLQLLPQRQLRLLPLQLLLRRRWSRRGRRRRRHGSSCR